MNKSIPDQSWFEFRRQLACKLAWPGGALLSIPPQYTSQTCSHCGCVDQNSRPAQAKFKCTACGFELNADHDAALNILAAGHAVSACGAGRAQAPALKREPAWGADRWIRYRQESPDFRRGRMSSNLGSGDQVLHPLNFFYRLFGDRLNVVHMHLSHSYEVTDTDEYFPFRFGKEVYGYIASTHQLAFTDNPTELDNRNAYETDLIQLFEHLSDMSSLGMVLFDLNNDSLGHFAGDQLIRSFAFLFKESIPDMAKLYRYGGDKFAVFLPETDRGVLGKGASETGRPQGSL